MIALFKSCYMLETPCISQYLNGNNLLSADNQQGSLSDPSETTRRTPQGEDIVRSAWRHAEIGRNDLSPLYEE